MRRFKDGTAPVFLISLKAGGFGLNLAEADWQKGLVSPSMELNHHINQPIAMNGYLQLSGNAEFTWYDIEDPAHPKRLSQIVSPGFDPTMGNNGEAESHQVSLARYGDRFYEVTTAGTGVDIWNMTDQAKPALVEAKLFLDRC